MNYVDNGLVVDDLLQLARKANGERISIHWIPPVASEQFLTPRILKSIDSHREWLAKHFENSGTSIEAVREFRTDVFLKRNKQIAVQAYLVDDRGKEYTSDIFF